MFNLSVIPPNSATAPGAKVIPYQASSDSLPITSENINWIELGNRVLLSVIKRSNLDTAKVEFDKALEVLEIKPEDLLNRNQTLTVFAKKLGLENKGVMRILAAFYPTLKILKENKDPVGSPRLDNESSSSNDINRKLKDLHGIKVIAIF